MTANKSLRTHLDTACTLGVLSEYRIRLAELKQEFRHSIVILPDGVGKIERFNCFAYAFGIWNDVRYDHLVENTQTSVLMNSAFVTRLLSRGDMVEVAVEDVRPNDIVLYFAGEQLRHAGRIVAISDSPAVHSKWGGNEVHEHKLWELPLQHGDRVRYFRPLDASRILDELEVDQQ